MGMDLNFKFPKFVTSWGRKSHAEWLGEIRKREEENKVADLSNISIKQMRRELAKKLHPDVGGDHTEMCAVNGSSTDDEIRELYVTFIAGGQLVQTEGQPKYSAWWLLNDSVSLDRHLLFLITLD